MYCKNCGTELGEGADYCSSCGADQRGRPEPKKTYGGEWMRLKTPGERKNPGAAAALGFFLGWIPFIGGPLGYIYLGQWNWFWLTFIVSFVAYPLTLGLAYVVLPVVYGIHQYQMAQSLNALLAEEHRRLQSSPAECPPGAEPAAKPEL